MQIDDPIIVALIERVDAACQEVEFAIQLHEAWKPPAFDQALMSRMSHSYAGNTFLTIRIALRREVILAMMRLWDNDSRALNLKLVAKDLKNPEVVEALAADRASRIPIPGAREGIRRDLQANADKCRTLIEEYLSGGASADAVLRLRGLRNQQLAHRQMTPVTILQPEPERDEVEDLYNDMLDLTGGLFSLVKGIAYKLEETAAVYSHHAGMFWEAVRSERTEGHPRYKQPQTN